MLFQIIKQLEKDINKEGGFAQVSTETISKSGRRMMRAGSSINIPPVLQLNKLPEVIDVLQYRNAHGPTNPNGDYISLFRISDLTNQIPQFTQLYFPSGKRIDDVYEMVILGATIKPDATFTNNAFYNSKQLLSNLRLSNLGGTPDNWYPVYATPTDWYDQITNKENLFTSEIDFSNPEESFDSQFSVIASQSGQNLGWNKPNTNGQVEETSLSQGSTFNKIRFKYLQVQLSRPWLSFDIFDMGGWYLGGQETGYISSGDISDNGGVFPLYPVSFIIATDLEIESNLNDVDTKIVSESINESGSINLGPFSISTISTNKVSNLNTLTNDGYFIIAWISQLVHLSPKDN